MDEIDYWLFFIILKVYIILKEFEFKFEKLKWTFQLLNLNQNSTAWNQRGINVNDVSLQTQFLSSLITLNEQASFETERSIQIGYLCYTSLDAL